MTEQILRLAALFIGGAAMQLLLILLLERDVPMKWQKPLATLLGIAVCVFLVCGHLLLPVALRDQRLMESAIIATGMLVELRIHKFPSSLPVGT